jgi:hypothetical protein
MAKAHIAFGKVDQGLNVMILHVPVYDKRLSEDEGGVE